ncbi:hypothetical protein FM038_013315 [Shewanella eurypsychrophilus]|uniref:Uncharacterized protein n=1 Tax=Shewanella eurypsychrophilus TaxID=2593656 RepID=A0A550AKV1_9GAMM|nr:MULTISPECIES: hypothetical protein [Shewanella]QFU23034.1 hypothetical protein FS418_14900 [Shewanella sp. YLB-09]QPG58317.2 hypothetical protein FM038_013315 [Shewanella eurypsychrophilus]
MMDSALIFATIVQLFGVWRAERQIVGEDDNLDINELLSWMRTHRFDDLADAIESNSSLLEDLKNESENINSKLDQVLQILSGGDINIDISPEMIEFMNWIKPEETTVSVAINGSLVNAMVRCVDEKLEGLTILGNLGRRQLMGIKLGDYIPMEVEDDDWAMMKDDLETLWNADVFECDYELEYDRYLVKRKLEELVERTLREHVE